MKCLIIFVLLTFPCLFVVDSAEINIHAQIDAMAKQIEEMKASHTAEIALLKKEMKEIKSTCTAPIDNHERNEQLTLKWAKEAMNELRTEMKELSESINNSILLQELNDLRNGVQQSLMEKKDLMQLARTQEARLDKLDNEVSRLKHEGQQMRTLIAQQKSHIGKLNKELKYRDMNALTPVGNNDVMDSRPVPNKKKLKHGHKYRHNKMVHTQISRLARSQDDIEEYQQTLQMQLLDVQRRVDRIEESNWNLLSTKVEFLEVQIKTSLEELQNVTQKLSDLDKFHASILELREEIENIENKADKTVPEFRKEISKLDINLAQLNAQTSYIKEDQENLRQSVKAIAVSVSNAIDRAEVDRTTLKSISHSVNDLQNKSKQHSYRLNDHILKSEANFNMSITSSTQEIMEEVKELMPVEREYEDLVNQLPKDCSTVSGPAGVYLIRPGNSLLNAWCDNHTTLIQRRYNGTVDFNRKYADYIRGFGDPNSEYWLGLEAIHLLTSEQCSSMRIDMTDIYGAVWYAEYDHFSVGNGDKGYVLDVSGFKGNASDAFDYQNHMEFSAIDHDRDISNTHCAGNYEGGWWFSHCQHVNLNGKYNLGLTWFDSVRNEWIAVATSEIRTFRRPGCP